MKNSKFLLLSFLFVQSSFLSLNAQGGDPPVPNLLFLFGQIDVPDEIGIIYTLTALGTYWDFDTVNEEFPVSDDSDLEEAFANISGSTTPEPSYYGSTAWKGFIFPWQANPYIHTDDIAYGFYKVTNSYNDYFYIDIRDCKYIGPPSFVSGTYNPDFFIRFDDDTDIFEWKAPGGLWIEISTGEVLKVWEIRNNGIPPTTSFFEDFWENALVMANNESDHPRIVWGPHPSFTTTHFYIYRAVADLPLDPKEPLTFSHTGTTNATTYEFVDFQFEIGGSTPNYMAFYIVKAYNSSSETFSPATNGVNTTGEYVPYKVGSDIQSEAQPLDFDLKQNFPNPFNPTTQIDYTIKLAELVTIKVYDVLGNEVASLVNEKKQPGDYSTTFNAVNLPSGIYIYLLRTENFTDTKKMLMLK